MRNASPVRGMRRIRIRERPVSARRDAHHVHAPMLGALVFGTGGGGSGGLRGKEGDVMRKNARRARLSDRTRARTRMT